MSASNQTAGPSTDNFTAIFNAALNEYQMLTGKSLDNHPFAAQLDSCQNPEAISNVLRTQAEAFSKFRKGDERLMAWLDPTIHILFTFSDTLGEGIGLVSKPRSSAHNCSQTPKSQPFSPAKPIFTGIGALLGVCPSLIPLLWLCMIFND
jgi:fungal STAND N-terminal Goodbye domain